MAHETEDELVPAAFTIPAQLKARIEREAKANDRNASQVVRRILREYFERVDQTDQPAAQAA
jgi:hypothetical protein